MTAPTSIVLALCILTCSWICASAQAIPIKKSEFDDLVTAAFAKTSTRSRRETTQAKTFEAGKLVEEELTTQDYLPPDKERWLILARKEGVQTRVEIVYIGDVEYRREGRGAWTKTEDSDRANQTTTVSNLSAQRLKGNFVYFKEEADYHGKKVRVLTERSGPALSTPGPPARRITVDQDGLILKVEESVTEGLPDNIVFTSVATIVYASHAVVIEAPIN